MGSFCVFLTFFVAEAVLEVEYPRFPPNFTAKIESNLYGDQFTTIHVKRWTTADGKSKYHVLSNQTGTPTDHNGLYLLLTDCPGSFSGSTCDKNRATLHMKKEKCEYSCHNFIVPDLVVGLPALLGQNIYDTCIGFQVCPDMKYVGPDTSMSTPANIWNALIPNIIKTYGPDNLTVIASSETGFPLYAQRHHPGHTGTFNPSSTIFSKLQLLKSSLNFDVTNYVPDDWMKKCRNLDVGWNTSVLRQNFYVNSTGNDSTTFFLIFPPAWDNVTVTFYWNREKYPGCECDNCFEFSPTEMVFTQSNYHKPQTLTLMYKSEGCGGMGFNYTGSGWEYASMKDYIIVHSCKDGVAGVACPK